MLWKRHIPVAIVTIVGFLTLFGWFVDEPHIESFINDDATQWYDILASFAVFLGALNLLKMQMLKVSRKKRGWPFALVTVVSFLFAFTAGFLMRGAHTVEVTDAGPSPDAVAAHIAARTGADPAPITAPLELATDEQAYEMLAPYFTERGARNMTEQLDSAGATTRIRSAEWGAHLSTRGSLFNWMFDYIFSPLSSTMFALLAFFVASASYRAFRARNFEATLLLVSGIIIMLGRVPIGSLISSWFVMYILVLLLGIGVNSWYQNRKATFATVALGVAGVTAAGMAMGWPVDRPAVFFLPILQDWIYNYPNVAGARAIMIGIGLGVIATSIRYILGIERSYLGE